MDLKRELTNLAKQMSPQIEVMNVATEIRQACKRVQELITYAQTKIDRSAERKGMTIAKQADERRKAEEKVVSDAQQAEVEENQKDQKESFDERNKVVEKSKKKATKK